MCQLFSGFRTKKVSTFFSTIQAIVEHPYGIIKRQWGFYYIAKKKEFKERLLI
jgi:hypothetical protein